MRNAETNIQNRIMLELSAQGAMVWRNQTGKFRSMNDPNRIVSVGQIGSADILACVPTLITLCLLYTSPSPRDRQKSRMPSSA